MNKKITLSKEEHHKLYQIYKPKEEAVRAGKKQGLFLRIKTKLKRVVG